MIALFRIGLFSSLLALISFITSAQQNKHLIHFEGKPIYINGLNVPWNNFGGDVGNHYLWGTLYNPNWFEKMFADCEAHGINCVRLWIHTDGRANPEFDKNGYVKGVYADFFPAFDDIMLRAKNHGILVMPCLWSFDMCKDFRKTAGMYAGNHADLITDSLKTLSYINNVLIPMVKRYDKHCNLFAWEVCNEPEWHMPRPGEEKWKDITEVPVRDMQRFTAMIAAAIHKHSSRMVTTGSAALKWNSDVPPAIGNWWSDQALQKAYPDKDAYLDFYQIHYYDWMYDSKYDPFNLDYPFEYWKLDKPCLIGEMPGSLVRDTIYSNEEKINNAYKNHYAGHMFWSYNGGDGVGIFADFKDACKKFYEEHKEEIFPIIPCKTLSSSNLQFKVKTEKGKNKLSWKAEDPSKVKHFIVEKSSDGKTFKWERTILPNENGDENYFYFDKTNGTKTYYRIRLLETTGFEGVSEVFETP
ncbi:MAG: cellulase family glycosylhydrolase [Cytophagaceae bacterium]|nr:cellulase family glycosylhydrolase [Cytophagaceae bacterium]MDW8455838.1 cellulase family glycosylhydrolase [Cytophagaceae bacterium]